MHSIHYVVLASTAFLVPLKANNTYPLPEEETVRARLASDFTYVDTITHLSHHFANTELKAAQAAKLLRERCNSITSKVHRLAAQARTCELIHALYADQADNLLADLAAQNITLCKKKVKASSALLTEDLTT